MLKSGAVNQDDDSPVTASDESSRRIRRALRAELDRRWGQRRAINQAIGHGSEYLSKVCRRERPIKLDVLLLALEVMSIDAGRFFADALGASVANDSLLEELERFGEIHRHLPAIEKATVQLELSEPLGPAPPLADVEELLSPVVACGVKEERRRLRTAQKYRHPSFAAAYLEHLDALRYDNPKLARGNARVAAIQLIPRLPGSQRERMALQLKAIGIYASTHRHKEDSATAARAIRLALALARAHELRETTAELLQRGAYVLSGVGRYIDAMKLLDEALVIFVDMESQAGLARVQVDRSAHLYNLGEYRGAVVAAKRALKLLQGASRRCSRNRLVAHQVLAHSFCREGELELAEVEAAHAVTQSEKAGRVYRGYLSWDHGVIALKRHKYDLAEKRLREAARLLARGDDPNEAMATLDLAKSLVAQDKTLEAVAMAVSAAEYLNTLRGNKVAAAAVSDLMQTAIDGRVSLSAIERVQANLERAGKGMARNPLQQTDRSRRSQ